VAQLSGTVIASAAIALNLAAVRIASADTDTCDTRIAQLETLVDRSMGNATAKPRAPQSIDAQLHHQPTPASVWRAEQNAQFRLRWILAHAKLLNAGGKTGECLQSVAEAKRLLGINETRYGPSIKPR